MALTKITTNIIADDAVTADKIAAGAIDSTHVTGLSTSDISEGTNLYFTDARVGSYLTTNSYATESYVTTAVSNLVDAAPAALDTLNELAAALGDDANFSTTVTNSIATKVSKSGDTMTGNLSFGDNNKAIFGTGSDLQIFHDGSNSYVQSATGNFNITTAGGNEFALTAVNDGAVTLFHNGSAKLATTNTGIDVTGTITADGLTVADTTGTVATFTSSGVTTALNMDNTHANGWGSNIAFKTGGTAAGYFGSIGSLLGNTDQDLSVYATAGNGVRVYTNGANERMRIDSSGNVGLGNGAYIGTLSSTHSLSIQGGAGAPGGKITLYGGTGSNRIDFLIGTGEVARIDSGGNFAIANGNQTASTVSSRIMFGNKGYFTESSTGRAEIVGVSEGALWYSGTALAFLTNPGPDVTARGPDERMRITSAGLVGIGTTSPSSRLTVNGTSSVTAVAGSKDIESKRWVSKFTSGSANTVETVSM